MLSPMLCIQLHTTLNPQLIRENGTHIAVTFQISNLTSLAKIDPSTNVTAQQAVDLIAGNTFLSQAPFQIQISPNVSVTPTLHVIGRGPTNTAQCNTSNPNKSNTTNAPIATTSVPSICPKSSGVSSAVATVVALLLFIVGVLIGVIFQLSFKPLVVWCKKNFRPVQNIKEKIKYKKQEDVVNITQDI